MLILWIWFYSYLPLFIFSLDGCAVYKLFFGFFCLSVLYFFFFYCFLAIKSVFFKEFYTNEAIIITLFIIFFALLVVKAAVLGAPVI